MGWSFDDRNKPCYYLKVDEYARPQSVDPFPCYSHPEELTRAQILEVEQLINLPYKPKWFILSHECESRTNGWASSNESWDEKADDGKGGKGKYILNPFICLAGKRIPIMPAMTRYLVAHEYGHVVDYNIRQCLGLKGDEFKKMYAELRGIDLNLEYGARKWHRNISEVVANDIRIILLGKETEFWPHECDHPFKKQNVIDWWFEQLNKYFPRKQPLITSKGTI